MSDKPRWHNQFDDFEKTYNLLQEICARSDREELEQIAKEGMIQRFKLCIEMSWRTIKDYMEYKNFAFQSVLPNVVIKEAHAANLISSREDWFKALEDRNDPNETYDFQKFDEMIERIKKRHVQCFAELHKTLSAEIAKDLQ